MTRETREIAPMFTEDHTTGRPPKRGVGLRMKIATRALDKDANAFEANKTEVKRRIAMHLRQKRRGRRAGAAAVEMALILPMFLGLIFAQLESSRLGMVAQLLTTAARDACRVAVIKGSTSTQVSNQINTDLAGSGLAVPPVTYSITQGFDTASFGTAITVTLSVPYSQVSWLPTPYYLKTATVVGIATMIKEG